MVSKPLKVDVEQRIQTDEICENISDNIISITESKARLIYREYAEAPTKSAVFSDLGLMIAFATPIVTSDFKDFLGIPAELIWALFTLISVVFGGKFIVSAVRFFTKGRSMNEDNFLKELKGQTKRDNHKKGWLLYKFNKK